MKISTFLLRQYLYLFMGAIILLYLFPVDGSFDLKLITPWITQNGEFFLKRDWYLDILNHHYIKYILIFCYVSFLSIWVYSFFHKKNMIVRWDYAYFVLLVILSTSLIGVLKSQSDHACPWDMIIPAASSYSWNFNQNHGHCFPGGHASTGFALVAGFFIYRTSQPQKAWFYLMSGLIIGSAMGWAQMMRGAHFFSHNLWTLWFTWLINVVVYQICFKTLRDTVFNFGIKVTNVIQKTH